MVIGGNTPEETAQNYASILKKTPQHEYKNSPRKNQIFSESADMLGWIWEQGGFLKFSPHRQL